MVILATSERSGLARIGQFIEDLHQLHHRRGSRAVSTDGVLIEECKHRVGSRHRHANPLTLKCLDEANEHLQKLCRAQGSANGVRAKGVDCKFLTGERRCDDEAGHVLFNLRRAKVHDAVHD